MFEFHIRTDAVSEFFLLTKPFIDQSSRMTREQALGTIVRVAGGILHRVRSLRVYNSRQLAIAVKTRGKRPSTDARVKT